MEKREIRRYSKQQVSDWAVKVLQEQFGCGVQSIKYAGGGYFGFVYRAVISKPPHQVIIKAALSPDMYLSEAADLALLGKNCPVPVPEVYFTFPATGDIPVDFICMECMSGRVAVLAFSFSLLSKKKRQAFADKIVDAMLVWHEKTNDKFGFTSNAVFDSWLDFYRPMAEDILITSEKNEKIISKASLRLMKQAYDKFDYIFSETVDRPSLVHGDLNVCNILCDNNLNPTAIIDPLESKWADREFDLFQLVNMNGNWFGLYDTYKRRVKTSEKCDIKCAFYGLFNEAYCSLLADIRMSDGNAYVKWMDKELDKIRF